MATGFVDRVASTDRGYVSGDLSIYPVAKDDLTQLYVVSNNAQTVTTQSVSYNSSYFVVADTSSFPDQGLFQVGTEQVYYSKKTANMFSGLKRGFAGSRQNAWPIGTPVYGAVFAEPHNALKDAALNIERNLGTAVNPDPLSLNGLLDALETRFLAPRPVFRADPRFGTSPLTVTFQNFSEGPALRYLWEFGDGATSQEFAPTHTYMADGSYSVQLSMITVLGAQGVLSKTDYINVGAQFASTFFYVTPTAGTTSTVFEFVDQTDGEITSRYWVWDDGSTTSVTDPNVHAATHQYTSAGTYSPSLMVVFSDDSKKIIQSNGPIVVS